MPVRLLLRGIAPLALAFFALAGVQEPSTFVYGPFDESLAERIVLHPVEDSLFDGEKVASPNRAGAFWSMPPDFTEEPPWTTTFYVQHEAGETLRLAFLDHANVAPTARWINDELLYVNVWWGRIAGTDLVLDVPSGEFLYRRMFVWRQGAAQAPDEPVGDGPPAFRLGLEHIQGAEPPVFSRLEILSSEAAGETVRQIEILTVPPMVTECILDPTDAELEAVHDLLEDFLREMEDAPPRPVDTVCRNCTIYRLSWELPGGEAGTFEFSEQRPLRYPALDGLFPLIDGLLERMTREGECAA